MVRYPTSTPLDLHPAPRAGSQRRPPLLHWGAPPRCWRSFAANVTCDPPTHPRDGSTTRRMQATVDAVRRVKGPGVHRSKGRTASTDNGSSRYNMVPYYKRSRVDSVFLRRQPEIPCLLSSRNKTYMGGRADGRKARRGRLQEKRRRGWESRKWVHRRRQVHLVLKEEKRQG